MYGTGAFGEAGFGESPGGAFPVVGDIAGSMGAIESKDIFSARGTTPQVSGIAVADPNILVLVVELELGQLGFTQPSPITNSVTHSGVNVTELGVQVTAAG
jgi:hypothetical protein